ncbi:MAG: hypothetical protein J7M29_05275, partial [Verrucomicrobia bacterium]|nr:hypothetical protein [Verrucomicrobiota bacterium]
LERDVFHALNGFKTVTDASGRFEFKRAPAGTMLLVEWRPAEGGGKVFVPLKKVEVAPGQTVELEISQEAALPRSSAPEAGLRDAGGQ